MRLQLFAYLLNIPALVFAERRNTFDTRLSHAALFKEVFQLSVKQLVEPFFNQNVGAFVEKFQRCVADVSSLKRDAENRCPFQRCIFSGNFGQKFSGNRLDGIFPAADCLTISVLK